jgi:hypothetical protein
MLDRKRPASEATLSKRESSGLTSVVLLSLKGLAPETIAESM